MYRPNISIIVFRKSDGKFLLVRKPREHHAWQFPQGGIESGETSEVAAKRELLEELGTDTFKGFYKSKHVFFYDFPVNYRFAENFKGQKQNYLVAEYFGSENDIRLSAAELDEYRWVYQNELPQYLESPEYLKKINQVIFEFRDLI